MVEISLKRQHTGVTEVMGHKVRITATTAIAITTVITDLRPIRAVMAVIMAVAQEVVGHVLNAGKKVIGATIVPIPKVAEAITGAQALVLLGAGITIIPNPTATVPNHPMQMVGEMDRRLVLVISAVNPVTGAPIARKVVEEVTSANQEPSCLHEVIVNF